MMPVSPVRVLERLRGQLPKGFFKRMDLARERAAAAGNVPDPADGWMFLDTASKVAEEWGGALYERGIDALLVADITNAAAHSLHALPVLATWRHTRGVYDFDADLLELLADTPIDELPTAALTRLPEYAPYLVMNGCRFQGESIEGAWVNLALTMSGLRILKIVLHYQQDRVTSIALPMKEGVSLQDMVYGAVGLTAEHQKWTSEEINGLQPQVEETIRLVEHVMRMALYLVSQEPDIEGAMPAPPSLQYNMGERGAVPPQSDNMLAVGFKHGGVIRMWKQDLSRRASDSSGLGMPKAPHIRRAHFALRWCGTGRTIPRIVWIAPVAVNVKNIDDVAVHLRPVQGDPADAR